VDLKICGIFVILPNISVDDMVLFRRIAIYFKNNNLHSIGIYNSYGSNNYEIITHQQSPPTRVIKKNNKNNSQRNARSKGHNLFLRL